MGRRTMHHLGVLGLYTESSLHCGAESGSGYVDLPIQRERHTAYPLIPGSTMKGVLRDEMTGRAEGGETVIAEIFGAEGPEKQEGDASRKAPSPGHVTFGDGVLVAFPVRSSGAPFHWVTCPFVLERVGRALGHPILVRDPGDGNSWGRAGGEVLLEENRLKVQAHPTFFVAGGGLERLLGLLPTEDRGFGHTRRIFADRLLIVSDGTFRQLVETATEVVTRIKLNFLGTTTNLDRKEFPRARDEKGVESGPSDWDLEGNLFVQELVPPETLFLCSLRALQGAGRKAAAILKDLPVIRLGGDETIGRGLTHLCWVPGGSGGSGAGSGSRKGAGS